jgi:hypothetical protein
MMPDSNLLSDDNPQMTQVIPSPTDSLVGIPIENWPVTRAKSIALDSCEPLETVNVKTRQSAYEMIVVSGSNGEVLLRGGRHFPEFRRAVLAGATAGGSALRLRTIEVGLRMELHAGGHVYFTSPVESFSRVGSLRSSGD